MRFQTQALAILSGLLWIACGGESPPRSAPENGLVIALANAPTNLDPRIGSDQSSGRIYEVMLNGLVTKDPRGNLIPDLATSWEVLEGGRRYRFHLRPGVRFHNGRLLTADDVVWTFATILDGRVTTPKKGVFEVVERVERLGPLTVDFVLREPFGALLVNLTSFMGIVPAGTSPEEFNRKPVGTGPFRIVEQRPDLVVLEAFDAYWDGRPNLDRLVFREIPDSTVRALELYKGSVQLVTDLPPDVIPRFRAAEEFRVVESPGAKYAYLGLNMDDMVLSDSNVRRALALGLDRERLVRTLWRGLGVVTETALPPGHWARNEELTRIPFDPPTAMRLLDEAGYPDPDGPGPGSRLDLTYKTSTDETALLQAQIIQEMLSRIGVGIEIRSYEFATFYSDIKRGSFQLFSLTWTGVVDPDIYSQILHSERIPPQGANRGRYRNPEFDQLVEAGGRHFEPELRRPFYLRAQEILARDLPYISLFNKMNVAVMPVDLLGFENYPSGELYSLKRVRWDPPRPLRRRATPPDRRRPAATQPVNPGVTNGAAPVACNGLGLINTEMLQAVCSPLS